MLNVKSKNFLHLHILVFIAGFTAILGELISLNAISLVWYRMIIASILIFIYIKIAKVKLKIMPKSILKLSVGGIIIALHWITFFASINASNISITLAMFSTGAFFAALIEPLFFKRKIIWHEILFGFIVIIGIFIITQGETKYINGIVLGISAAFFSSLFAVLNGVFLKKHTATVISFYEFLSGVFFISLYIMFFGDGFSLNYFKLSISDFGYLFILASICTAYAFIASIHVMKFISPFTVVLTYNLEPIYSIIMAVILFPEKEKMSLTFYYGTIVIIGTVIINALLKNIDFVKRKKS